MTNATILIGTVLSLLAGCSRDPFRNYVGLWERVENDARSGHEVVEITRDGQSMLFSDNVLQSTDFFGRPKHPMVMTQRDGQLSVSNGLGGVPLGLSDDEFLLVADRRYKQISDKRLKEIRQEIENEKRAAEQERARCKELDAQWKKERDALPHPRREPEELLSQKREIFARYEAKAKELPHCSVWW